MTARTAEPAPAPVDEGLLNRLVNSRSHGKCRFAAVVEAERPELMATFERAFELGAKGTVVAIAMAELGLSRVNEKTVTKHINGTCSCSRSAA